MSAIKQLNHYFRQSLHFYLSQMEHGEDHAFHLMYKDKFLGAVSMIETLPFDSELKQHAQTLADFIAALPRKTRAEIIAMLETTRD